MPSLVPSFRSLPLLSGRPTIRHGAFEFPATLPAEPCSVFGDSRSGGQPPDKTAVQLYPAESLVSIVTDMGHFIIAHVNAGERERDAQHFTQHVAMPRGRIWFIRGLHQRPATDQTLPLLIANLYPYYLFDLWADIWRKKVAMSDVIVVRYADDLVVGFQHRTEAERFLQEFRERLAKFGLELHPDKTRLIEFGRFAARDRKQRGRETRDLHLPGLYPLLWATPQERNLHRMADHCEEFLWHAERSGACLFRSSRGERSGKGQGL
jgi:hypothetical protein